MQTKTWAERLTPFTGGASISLLIVALVVQPARAASAACYDCNRYWTNYVNSPNGPCANMPANPPYYRQSCRDNFVWGKCEGPQHDADGNEIYVNGVRQMGPCSPQTTGGSPYSDCGSEYCSEPFQCNGGDWTTTCTNLCGNCDEAGHNCNHLQRFSDSIELSPCYQYCGCGSPPKINP